ncbi:response regulator [Pseudomonas aeruginosa]
MRNKALRILVADKQHFHRMTIERELNALGYYRIAPINTLRDLLALIDFGDEAVDALVINAAFVGTGDFDLVSFCQDSADIRHALIYGANETSAIQLVGRRHTWVSASSLPDAATLRALMFHADPWGQEASPTVQASGDAVWPARAEPTSIA